MGEVVTATVSAEGQLIIPRKVREKMKLKRGDKVVVALEKGKRSRKIQDDFSDLLKASESSLGFWDNESDEVWNHV